jgi:hypothetical protein
MSLTPRRYAPHLRDAISDALRRGGGGEVGVMPVEGKRSKPKTHPGGGSSTKARVDMIRLTPAASWLDERVEPEMIWMSSNLLP